MKVKFLPQDVEFEIQPGQSVMNLAHEKGIPIRSACNGMPSCAECRVLVTDGDWNVNPPSRKELSLIGTGYYIDQRRLSCQMQCFGDITIDTAEQIEKATEGPVTKKFLTKVQKTNASDSHSIGGVLIEQDGQLLKEMKNSVSDAPPPTAASISEKKSRGGSGAGHDRGARGGERGGRRGGGGGGSERAARGTSPGASSGPAGGEGGGNAGASGGGKRRRRRGGRGRG